MGETTNKAGLTEPGRDRDEASRASSAASPDGVVRSLRDDAVSSPAATTADTMAALGDDPRAAVPGVANGASAGTRRLPDGVIVVAGHAMTRKDLRGAWDSDALMVDRERRSNQRLGWSFATLAGLRAVQFGAAAGLGMSAISIEGTLIAFEVLAAGVLIGTGFSRIAIAVLHRHERRVLFGPGGPKAARRLGFGPNDLVDDDAGA